MCAHACDDGAIIILTQKTVVRIGLAQKLSGQ